MARRTPLDALSRHPETLASPQSLHALVVYPPAFSKEKPVDATIAKSRVRLGQASHISQQLDFIVGP